MWAVKKTLFLIDFPLLRRFDTIHVQGRASFGETAEAEYADVLILGRTSATIAPIERLRNLTYSLVRDSPCSVLSI
jgi:hypothetical protein